MTDHIPTQPPLLAVPRFPHLRQDDLRECDSVAMAALEHLGKQYRITRELHPGLIDCSTVVSQSHWVGAGIQTPFIAESQRTAANSFAVDPKDLLPGDAIYAYPGRKFSPGGRHNHVVLFLGHDDNHVPWAIESREDHGAILITLDNVLFDGGIRRFCINPRRVFPTNSWTDLVRRVPKLGRLGARLTAKYGSCDRHRGLDIYNTYDDLMVASPLTGSILDIVRVRDRGSFAGLWSPESRVYTVVGPVITGDAIRVGKDVEQGDILGEMASGPSPGGCNLIPGVVRAKRVHWELWAPPEFGLSPAQNLRCDWLPRSIAHESALIPHNPIYTLKLGKIGSCIASGVAVTREL
jgi:hypothetical protein